MTVDGETVVSGVVVNVLAVVGDTELKGVDVALVREADEAVVSGVVDCVVAVVGDADVNVVSELVTPEQTNKHSILFTDF